MEEELDVTVYCARCGAIISAKFLGNEIYIEPCEKCLEDEYDKGFEKGQEEAK